MVDPELIKRCQAGGEEAFDALYRAVYKRTVWTARLVCGNPDKADDIVQETFYECFRDIGKLQKPELFQAWFNRILVRKCRKHTRNSRPVESLDDGTIPEQKADIDVLRTVEANQETRRIREAVGRLNPPLRTTIVLYYFNELSIREIAQVMGCFQGTVKSRLHYGRMKLGKELEEDFYPDSRIYRNSPEEGTVYD